MKRTTYLLAASAVVAALLIAGCGGGGGSTTSSSGTGSGPNEEGGTNAGNKTAESGGTISSAEISGLGKVLVDSEGMTVYEWTVDQGTTSACYGSCETAWPPVITTGKPTAGEGAMSADLGTTKRKNGTMQVTYKGHPLYTFSGDSAPGEANGQEVEGTWFALDEAGTAVKGKSNSESGSEESSGGGGY